MDNGNATLRTSSKFINWLIDSMLYDVLMTKLACGPVRLAYEYRLQAHMVQAAHHACTHFVTECSATHRWNPVAVLWAALVGRRFPTLDGSRWLSRSARLEHQRHSFRYFSPCTCPFRRRFWDQTASDANIQPCNILAKYWRNLGSTIWHVCMETYYKCFLKNINLRRKHVAYLQIWWVSRVCFCILYLCIITLHERKQKDIILTWKTLEIKYSHTCLNALHQAFDMSTISTEYERLLMLVGQSPRDSAQLGHIDFKLLAIYVNGDSLSKTHASAQHTTRSRCWRSLICNQFGNELIINWLPLFTVLSITPALNICHLCYIPTPHTSASLRLPQSSLPTSCQDCSRLSWLSAYWPLYLELPPSSS